MTETFSSLRLALTAALVGTIVLAPCALSKEKPNPLLERVKASVKDTTKPFTMIVTLQAKKGADKKIEAAFAKAIKPTRQEKGCLAYYLDRDPKMPGQYIVYERWKDLAALEAHLKSRHIVALLADLDDVLSGSIESRILVAAGD
jgi:quinol monooxygenase YgiN